MALNANFGEAGNDALLSLADKFLNVYRAVGLGNFVVRQTFFYVFSFGILYWLKPSFAFRPDGSMRPFAGISQESDATWFFYPIAAVGLALLLGFFP